MALLQSKWARALVALFFLLSGAFTTLLLSLFASSFWYLPCAILWTLSGFVWLLRPSWAVGLSTFPVLGIAVMLMPRVPSFWRTDYSYRIILLSIAVALVLIGIFLMKEKEARKVTPFAVSLGLVLAAFGVDRLFTNKVAVHTYSMSWTANGTAPWGQVETDEKGQAPVVIFRRTGKGYCYDAVFSPELKARLLAANKPSIEVEYNTFSDFGHERSYNIRSVDGLIFNERDRPVRAGERYGGTIMDGSGSFDCQR